MSKSILFSSLFFIGLFSYGNNGDPIPKNGVKACNANSEYALNLNPSFNEIGKWVINNYIAYCRDRRTNKLIWRDYCSISSLLEGDTCIGLSIRCLLDGSTPNGNYFNLFYLGSSGGW